MNPLLRVFRHPVVWFSIAVLLVNDHWLKDAAPSWLTGKLSDFAGLFFFPFLLAAGIICLSRRRIAARKAILVSMALTGLAFAALKSVPAANQAAVAVLLALLGPSVRIILDPSDLIALVVFAPAWYLWRRVERAPEPSQPGRLAYAALAIGSLAAVATAPCPTPVSAQNLAVVDGTVYLGSPYNTGPHYLSQDISQGWKAYSYTAPAPPQLQEPFRSPAVMPVTACDPSNPQVCYRIDGRPRVDESQDGGKTWKVSWQIPPGRDEYIRRSAKSQGFMTCANKTADLATFDLALLPSTMGTTVIVSMGNEGLLVLRPGAGWTRSAIHLASNHDYFSYSNPSQDAAIPTPFTAPTFRQALMDSSGETAISILIAIFAYFIFSIQAWRRAFANRLPGIEHAGLRTYWPFIFILVWILLFLSAQSNPFFRRLDWVDLLLLPLGFFIAFLLIWLNAAHLVAHPWRYRLIGGLALLAGLGLAIVPPLCVVLWAFGWFPYYVMALILAFVLGELILIQGLTMWLWAHLVWACNP